LKGGDFKTGQVLCTVKYADDFVLLAKQETVLLGMTDRLLSHLARKCVLKFVIAGKVQRTRILGRRRKQLLDDLQEKRMGKRTRVLYIYIYVIFYSFVDLLYHLSESTLYDLHIFPKCLLSFGAESFVFQFAIQKFKD